MTKLDQEAAYRHVPVRPEDLHLQFVKWADKYFQETRDYLISRNLRQVCRTVLVPLRPKDQRNDHEGRNMLHGRCHGHETTRLPDTENLLQTVQIDS